MSPRRSFYSRQQVVKYCGVSLRTVIRWEGVHLTKLRDPRNPRRVVYDGTEVESWERTRRRRRESGIYPVGERAPPREERQPSPPRGKAAEGPSARSAARPPTPPSRPRDEADAALERWEREIDERKRQWEAEHPDGEESERPPRSSGGRP